MIERAASSGPPAPERHFIQQHRVQVRQALLRRCRSLAAVGVLAAVSLCSHVVWVPAIRPTTASPARCRSRVACRAQRCPGYPQCGCDGQGRVMGFLGKAVDWSPVKAFRKCPKWRGPWTNKGIGADDLFKTPEYAKESFLLEVPATWRSLTKIKLRQFADVKAAPTGEMLKPFQKFAVEEVIRRDGQHFLKLSGRSGWAFDRGVAGTWVGKPICERLDD